MRVPLSWLCDFAPFAGDPADLARTLDELGLVVEAIEVVGQGLDDVVVARVESIAPIDGADRIRRVVVDRGSDAVDVVCGAGNFEVGDLVPLAPVGTVLPGGFEIGRRKMRGVWSEGMLCSGAELGLSEDAAGLLVVSGVEGAVPGAPLAEVLGIERDVVFDIAVEANRPDAWCVAGVARDLAARLGLPFAIPDPAPKVTEGPPAASEVRVSVESPELCPRFTARLLTGVQVAPSGQLVARRLTLAGMRPINNVVDASNYVMLELGQPTHPYDRAKVAGSGFVVRQAVPGETVTTLDGVVRELGRTGPALGDTGIDCLVCDRDGSPLGIGGIMGGASSEIDETTTEILFEAAYFDPMTVARTSKRLNLRTEASARFERGCDPAGIDRAALRFVEVLAETAGPALVAAAGSVDAVGPVPSPVRLRVRPDRVNGLLGTALAPGEITELLGPLGIEARPAPGSDGGVLDVVVPTFRPDIRPSPWGEADIAEEVGRTFGYGRLPRTQPAWSAPGRLSDRQRERRLVAEVMVGLGATEAWTPSIVDGDGHTLAGFGPEAITVANPLAADERFLRRSMLPGLLRAVARNADRRQGEVRLFEIGTVFPVPVSGPDAVDERELLAAVFALRGDDARMATVAWHLLAAALRIDGVVLRAPAPGSTGAAGLHPTRVASLVTTGVGDDRGSGQPGAGAVVGVVGEVDPVVAERFGLPVEQDGASDRRRFGWLEVDLGTVLDPAVVRRRSDEVAPVSRFPSSDIDLAFVTDEMIPADVVGSVLADAAGDVAESVDLFDVYRGPGLPPGTRSLAFRLRLCALDRTLTDAETGEVRSSCIAAVRERLGATLR
jgi:phenylalanyl-tRNA synthetase beta chain